jgi:hypothetical protein
VISYQLPLCAGTQTSVKAERFTESESETPGALEARGCAGSTQNEAVATPGHLCVLQASGPGGQEFQWKDAKFVAMKEPDALQSETSGQIGERVVFQTNPFSVDAKGTIAAGGAYLAAGGPWAVTAP